MARRGQRRNRPTGGIIPKLLVVLAVAGAGLAPALFALSSTSVNSTRDLPDAIVGDGVCDTGAISGQTECTLRAAIQEANFDPASTTITFAIPTTDGNHAGGIWTIPLIGELPPVTTSTTIDATTQPGHANGVPVVVVDGTGLAAGDDGFTFAAGADNSVLRGFSIVNIPNTGAVVEADLVELTGNFLGVLPDGAPGPNTNGIQVSNGAFQTDIGGSGERRNVISESTNVGIIVTDVGTESTLITGNLIGLAPDGLSARANRTGIQVRSSAVDTTILSSAIAENDVFGIDIKASDVFVYDNRITGNGNDQIQISSGAQFVEIGEPGRGNEIVDGGADGVAVLAGSTNVEIVDNTIRGNVGAGVVVDDAGTEARISQNKVYDNGGIGIDLGSDGETDNDPNDGDNGPNDLLNKPVIVSETKNPTATEVRVELDLPPAANQYVIEFFDSDSATPGSAQRFVDQIQVAFAGNSPLEYSHSLPPGLSFVTATVSEVAAGGEVGATSEISDVVDPVHVVNPGNQTNTAGDVVSLPMDVNVGLGLRYTATGLPSGLVISDTGVISGTIDPTVSGDHTVVVNAEVLMGLVLVDATTEFVWTVNPLTNPTTTTTTTTVPPTTTTTTTTTVPPTTTCLLYTSPSPRD